MANSNLELNLSLLSQAEQAMSGDEIQFEYGIGSIYDREEQCEEAGGVEEPAFFVGGGGGMLQMRARPPLLRAQGAPPELFMRGPVPSGPAPRFPRPHRFMATCPAFQGPR